MKVTTVFALTLALAAGSAWAQQDKQSDRQSAESSGKRGAERQAKKDGKQESSADAKRMQQMAMANLAEIETGKMAQSKAQSEDVKKFAQHMVDDHSKMLQEVQQLAQSKSVQLPSAPDKKHQAAMKKLEGLSGADFDRAYMQQMVKDHRDTLKLAQRTAKGAKDDQLKSSAQKAAPNIQEHLKMAQQLSSDQGKAGAGRSGKSQ